MSCFSQGKTRLHSDKIIVHGQITSIESMEEIIEMNGLQILTLLELWFVVHVQVHVKGTW